MDNLVWEDEEVHLHFTAFLELKSVEEGNVCL